MTLKLDLLSFRKAVASDLAPLANLVNSAYRGDSSRQGWTTEADLLGGQRTDPEGLSELIQKNSEIILLTHQADIIGCVNLKLEKTGWVYLGLLTVAPGLQNSGLGKRLLQVAEEWALRQNNVLGLRMTVIEQRSELIAWYERHGFKRTGETEAFPYHDLRFGLPQRQDLGFVVLTKSFR